MVLLTDVVPGFNTFSGAPRLARKSGTYRSGSPVGALWRANQTWIAIPPCVDS
jgi:hypothetical protein